MARRSLVVGWVGRFNRLERMRRLARKHQHSLDILAEYECRIK